MPPRGREDRGVEDVPTLQGASEASEDVSNWEMYLEMLILEVLEVRVTDGK